MIKHYCGTQLDNNAVQSHVKVEYKKAVYSLGKSTDIERRSWNSYTAPCNAVISHGAPIGGIQVFANHTRGNKRKQNKSTIFARRTAFHACLSSCSACSTYAPDESWLF